MEKIKDFLLSIGISKNEASIFEALVKQGTSSVLDLSKVTEIHRSNIYDALRSLVHRGLVYQIKENKKTLFSARDLNSLKHYVNQRKIELDELLKNYQDKAHKSNENIIRISTGKFALREALYSMLESGKRIRTYGIPNEAPETFGLAFLKEFHKERIKRKILMSHIYNSDSIQRAKYLNKLKYTEARILPKKYDSFATTNIIGNNVIIFLWEGEVKVIEIKDDNLAKPYKNYFEILWGKAKKVV